MMTQRKSTLSSARQQQLQCDIAAHCPEVDRKTLNLLFEQLDPDYFNLFPASEIAAHVRLLLSVDAQHPVRLKVRPLQGHRAEVQLAAYDFLGSFTLLTGLMAVHGLNIVQGQVFSYQAGPGRKTPWGFVEGGLIIDVFTVEYDPDQNFDEIAQATFCAELNDLLQLLRHGQAQQARDTLNYRLIDSIRVSHAEFSSRLLPVEIRIDNTSSADWTIMHIQAEDSPGFLYSLSNALAMRHIYIHRVDIHSEAGKVQDVLYISRQRGGKITSEAGQRELKLIVSLIKQFTHFLTAAPDPAKALRHFDQLMDRLASSAAQPNDVQWLYGKDQFKALATVLGSSDFLWEDFLRMHATSLLPIIQNVVETDLRRSKQELGHQLRRELQTATTFDRRQHVLNTFKDREMFRIDIRHLTHPDYPFGAFSDELTDLAEVVIAAALLIAQQQLVANDGNITPYDLDPSPFALFALGKFGGREMGYASDIELLCVYDGQQLSQQLSAISASEYAEMFMRQILMLITARQAGVFEIDLRLRPFGSHGPLATSYDQFCAYYKTGGGAAQFERQSLVKLRWVAGNARLGEKVEHVRDQFVYSEHPFDLSAATQLRQRQIDELVKPGTTDVKYSRGGLVDIEYTVQYLQLMHGAHIQSLHTTNTLQGLTALYDANLLCEEAFKQLSAAYVFLRHLIDALRIVRGHARDLVLPASDSEEFVFLARRTGYWDQQAAVTEFANDIATHMQHAAGIYLHRFLTPTDSTC